MSRWDDVWISGGTTYEELLGVSWCPFGDPLADICGYFIGTPRRRPHQIAISALARSQNGRWLTDRDPAEDDDVWLVTCFFARVRYRRHGFTHRLLEAVTEFAARSTGRRGLPAHVLAGRRRRLPQ